ncbi:hypothetical protein E8D34_16945 [Nocardioides sp. GY 10113]|uniref:hypothetical protein n=1 Tax=Nocardioides sp. GY 10113 TaxID=2569761 RepID=UPI0010A81E8F|nr:hypothetical protein [Nocardioides sp. GY 10113]TIC82504.1 hypothetical protein E8D34_16945 [Nocardioides sp. GY 10113]
MTRRVALLLGAGVIALPLVLHALVGGTLAGWPLAGISNNGNTLRTTPAPILMQVVGAGVCWSSDTSDNKSASCSNNLFGNFELVPGATASTVTVSFTNHGKVDGSKFTITPGACTSTVSTPNLCSYTETTTIPTVAGLTIAVACGPSSGALTRIQYPASTAAALVAAGPKSWNEPTPASGGLKAGASWVCEFTLALAQYADPRVAGASISQLFTWTLS